YGAGMFNAASTNSCCSRRWTRSEPVAGLELASRPTYSHAKPSARSRGSMKVQPPMFCDSSCAQIHSRARRRRPLVAQQALGRHQEQGLAELPLELPAEDVEVLRRRRRITDLNVVFGAGLQEPFQPGAGMLRPLALVAVRQQHHQAAVA